MKEYMQKLKDWWLNLTLKEKKAVSACAIVVGFFILYQGIWSPCLQHIAAMRKRINTQQKLLLWMQAADKDLQSLQDYSTAQAQATSPVLFLSYMQKQIRQAGLAKALTQMQEASNDAIEVHFQKVNFDRLITMLISVMRAQHVSVSQFSITAQDVPGIVNADLVLKLE